MENQDLKSAVNKVLKVLKKATKLIQLFPFVYLCFYSLYLLFGLFASEELLSIFDSVLRIPIIVTIGLLTASKLFSLCTWHKIACLLPTTTQIEGYIDNYIITFTQEEVLILNLIVFSIISIFLFLAYRHFFYYGR